MALDQPKHTRRPLWTVEPWQPTPDLPPDLAAQLSADYRRQVAGRTTDPASSASAASQPSALLSTAAAAQYIGISLATARWILRKHQVPHVLDETVGRRGRILYRRRDIDNLVEHLTRAGRITRNMTTVTNP